MLYRSGTTSVLVIQLENVKYFQQNIVKLKIQSCATSLHQKRFIYCTFYSFFCDSGKSINPLLKHILAHVSLCVAFWKADVSSSCKHAFIHIESLRFSTYRDDDARRAIDICARLYIYLFIYLYLCFVWSHVNIAMINLETRCMQIFAAAFNKTHTHTDTDR